MADWVERVTGIDPAGVYRGAYTVPREARNLIRDHGGALRFAGALLAGAGCVRTSSPEIGDVALVRAGMFLRDRIVFAPVGAIRVRSATWAIKSTGATLTLGNFPVIRAWKLPHA